MTHTIMDKNFEPIEQLYLSQAFDKEDCEEQMLAECKMIAKAYALAENAVVSMGDNRRNCSYCYFGGMAMSLAYPRRNISASCLHSTSTLSLTVAILMTLANDMLTRLPSYTTLPPTQIPSTIATMCSATICE